MSVTITDAQYSGHYDIGSAVRSRVVFECSVVAETNTSVTLNVTASFEVMSTTSSMIRAYSSNGQMAKVNVGQTQKATLVKSGSDGGVLVSPPNTWVKCGTVTSAEITVSKGTSTQTVSVSNVDTFVYADDPTSGSYVDTGSSSVSLYTVPKKSYTVSYNANGGSGAPSSQTKVHGTSITLRSSTPTRDGYSFAEWNTKSNGSGTGYDPDDTFSTNANTTLYAQWTAIVSSLTIGTVKAIRVADSSSTTEADEGECAYVTVKYTAKGAAAATISLAATCKDDQDNSKTCTVSANQSKDANADKTGTFTVRASTLDIEKRYTFALTVSAAVTGQATKTASKSVVLPMAFFTMDVLAGGKGVAFGKPATRQAFDVGMVAYFDKDAIATDSNNVEHKLTQTVKSPVNMAGEVASLSGATQIWRLMANCVNSNNADSRNGHQIGINVNNTDLSVYDYTSSASIYRLYSDQYTVNTDTVADICSAASNITINSASYRERAGMACFEVKFTPSAAISSATTVFTLASGKKPALTTNGCDSSTTYCCLVNTSGTVQCRRALTSGTSYTFRATYMLA